MKKYLAISVGLFAAWYVWKNYIQHNTALPGSFPTLGMGGTMTHGPISTQAGE